MKILLIMLLYMQQPDTAVANEYRTEAQQLMTVGQFGKAINMLEQAAPAYEEASDWNGYIQTVNMLSQAYGRIGKFDKAMPLCREAVELAKQHLPDTEVEMLAHKQIGILLEILGHLDESQIHTQRYLDLSITLFGDSSVHTGNAYNNLGLLYRKIGGYNRAIAAMKKAVEIKSAALGEDHPDVAKSYHNYGLFHCDKGDNAKGLEYLLKAYEIRKPHLPRNHPFVAGDYHAIGLAHEGLGDHALAQEYYNKSMTMQKEFFGNDHGDIVANLFQLGRLCHKWGDYERSVDYLKQALAMAQRVYGPTHTSVAVCWNDLGRVYLRMNEFDLAEDYLKKAIELRKVHFDSTSYYFGSSYLSLGRLERQREQPSLSYDYFEKANNIFERLGEVSRVVECLNEMGSVAASDSVRLNLYQRAMVANISNFSDTTEFLNPVLGESIDKYQTLLSLHGKASALQSLFDQHGKTEILELALTTFQSADTLIGQIRNSHISPQDKVQLGLQAARIYEGAIRVCMTYYEKSDDFKFKEMAFYFLERSKAQVLAGSINELKARKFGGVPDSILSREKQIRIDLSHYLSLDRDDKGLLNEEHRQKVFDLRREQEQLVAGIEKEFPRYAHLKYASTSLRSLGDVWDVLGPEQTILEYFQGTDEVYVFCISKGRIGIVSIPGGEVLQDLIQGMHEGLLQNDHLRYVANAHALYEKLIEPVAYRIETSRLLVIPDGALWNLNFDLLLSTSGENKSYAELDYLIKRYSIGYAYSASALFQPWESNDGDSELLAFSFSSSDADNGAQMDLRALRDDELSEIPGTSREIRSISQIWEGEYYYGTNANESTFKNLSRNYPVIHLALHGVVDNENPDNSRLHFAPKGDSTEDATLFAHELYNLDVNADLVVLSACNSGIGKTYKGEGVMSLGRAFAFSGTKSILLTQWEVSDAAAPLIMKNFYADLKEGLAKDEALRNAKLAFLANADNLTSNPFYWGSFFILGDASAIDGGQGGWIYFAMAIGAVIFIALVVRLGRDSGS